MDCKTVRERLSELVDGVLPVADAAAAHEHLAGCEDCRTERNALAAVWEALDTWSPLEPSDDFARGVMRRVATERATRVVPLTPVWAEWWRRPTVVSRMVAAFAVVILSAVLFVPGTQRMQPAPAELDEVIASFDTETQVAVLDDVPTYVVAHHGDSRSGKGLHRLLDPRTESPTDELLEDLLTEPKGNG